MINPTTPTPDADAAGPAVEVNPAKWIMVGWTRIGLYRVNREDGSRVAWFSDKTDAALAVSAVNAGGERAGLREACADIVEMVRDGVTGFDYELSREEAEGNVLAVIEGLLRAAPVAPRPEPAGEVEWREVLFFASYCGDDNPDCSSTKPCHACLGMSNVYRVSVHGAKYVRELASELNTEAALARRPEQWREIATLPNSGPDVLVFCSAEDEMGYVEHCEVVMLTGHGSYETRDSNSPIADGVEATHWMKLPNPPEAK